MAQGNVEQHSVRTNGVALCEMAQRNVEWYSVHTNSVALREMAQRNVEWYSVHTNSVALREVAQYNVEWYSVHTNGVAQTVYNLAMPFLYQLCYPAADPYTIFVFADLFDILVFLVVTAAKAIAPKPPKIQTANGTAICWGHDVIECED